jgi:hypothetical protein
MFSALSGNQTRIGNRRSSLDDPSRTHLGIAVRVWGALETSANTDFDQALARPGRQAPWELEKGMVDLASTRLRHNASARRQQAHPSPREQWLQLPSFGRLAAATGPLAAPATRHERGGIGAAANAAEVAT